MAKHFLYLTNETLTSLVWKGGGFTEKNRFSARYANALEFERHVEKHRRLPTYLVLDLTEEDFRIETVPHLRGSDQDAVLGRKLNQVFRNSPLRHAIVLGREEEGRRDDRVLLHGISNADAVRPWIAALEKLAVPLEGVYSAPVLSGRLLKALDVFFPHSLLVTLVGGDGLRQTYFQNKQVRFSRLTPIDWGGDEPFGQQIADEVSRTWQYLDSLRYFGQQDTLEVCILLHPKDRKVVTEAIRDYPLLQHRILDCDDVAAAIKLKPAPLDSQAEEIFCHLFAQGRLENHFAAKEATRVARLQRVGLGIHVLTGVALAGALGVSGYFFSEAQKLDQLSAQRTRQANAALDSYRALLARTQGAQISADTSRDASAFYRAVIGKTPAPLGAIPELAQVLEQFPQIKIAQLAWIASDDDKANPPLSPLAPKGTPSLRSEYKPDKAEPPVPVAATPPGQVSVLSGYRNQILLIDASTLNRASDYRSMLAETQRFVDALDALPGWNAAFQTPPLDVRSVASLRAKLADPAAPGATPRPVGADLVEEGRFVVRVVRSLELPS